MMLVYVGMLSIGSTSIFLKEVSESLYMVLCQTIATWTVVFSQGSCLGPLLFVVYASKLFTIIKKHLPNVHCFAHDTQLYLSFKSDDKSSLDEAISAMNRCISDLRYWMIRDRLMINDDKAELILIGLDNN